MMEITTSVETITPALAKQYLEKNIANRPKDINRLRRYVKAIAENRWKLNGESIKFNNEGHLFDGQHRLEAIVSAGKAIQTLVVRNLPRDTFITIDTGKTRTAGDILSIEGYKNSNTLSAALRTYSEYLNDKVGIKTAYTNAEIMDLAATYPDMDKDVAFALRAYAKCKLIRASILAACHRIFSEIDSKTCEEFFNKLINGINLEENSPIHLLRRKLEQNVTSTQKYSPRHQMAWMVKAWNAVRTSTEIKVLRSVGEKEDFPKAI